MPNGIHSMGPHSWDQHWNCFKGNFREMGRSAYVFSELLNSLLSLFLSSPPHPVHSSQWNHAMDIIIVLVILFIASETRKIRQERLNRSGAPLEARTLKLVRNSRGTNTHR